MMRRVLTPGGEGYIPACSAFIANRLTDNENFVYLQMKILETFSEGVFQQLC